MSDKKDKSQIQSTYGGPLKAIAGGADPGDTNFSIGLRADGMICIEFQRPCTFFAMNSEDAAKMGVVLIDYARAARARGNGAVIQRLR